MREVAPVVLEDEADRGEHGEQQPDQEEPPADREAESGGGGGEPEEQRPPAVRAEEADLAGALLDLAAATAALGLAIGWWLFLIGMLFTVFAAIGFVFEYYRGNFSH